MGETKEARRLVTGFAPILRTRSKTDWRWLVAEGFEVEGRSVLERRMQASRVIEAFNVLEDGAMSFVLIGETESIKALEFESAPERFHGRIVVAVGFATH